MSNKKKMMVTLIVFFAHAVKAITLAMRTTTDWN